VPKYVTIPGSDVEHGISWRTAGSSENRNFLGAPKSASPLLYILTNKEKPR
jgi:hypothetical protein